MELHCLFVFMTAFIESMVVLLPDSSQSGGCRWGPSLPDLSPMLVLRVITKQTVSNFLGCSVMIRHFIHPTGAQITKVTTLPLLKKSLDLDSNS